jgi:type VI secretion system protein ImpH
MAGESGTATSSVMERLRQEPYRFDFYYAARLLEAMDLKRPRLGTSLRPADDPVRFCQQPSLRFEPSTITEFRPARDGVPPRLFTAFLGLLGPNGPMPLHLTEYIRDRERNQADPTLARFLDLFHHRVISLFYRCWAVNQQAVSFDRPESDRFAVYIGSMFGIGSPPFRNRDEVPDLAKLHYSGRLACQTKNAEGLAAILEDFFRVPVRIEQFVGQWLAIPPESRLKLGDSPDTGTLGSTAIVGSRVWDCQQKFRIRMGPMSFADYQRMLPSGNSLKRLKAWVRNYINDELGFEVQLVLKAAEVPSLVPGRVGQLGWSTWMKSRPFEKDAEDLVLQVA